MNPLKLLVLVSWRFMATKEVGHLLAGLRDEIIQEPKMSQKPPTTRLQFTLNQMKR